MKNSLLTTLLSLICFTGYAQKDTTYFSQYHRNLGNEFTKSASYYELNSGKKRNGKVEQFYLDHTSHGHANYQDNKLHGAYVILYKDGKIKESGLYDKGNSVGLRKRRYPSGLMRSIVLIVEEGKSQRMVNAWDIEGNITVSEGNGIYEGSSFSNDDIIEKGEYKDGYKTGKWTSEKNGRLFFEDTYDDEGKFVNGISYDKDGKSFEYTEFEEDATYPGGISGWNRHLVRNLEYPADAKKYSVQGNVYVSFVVSKTGKIEDIEVTRGIGYGCDREAVRVVRKSKKWLPGKQRGQPVIQRMTLRIVFRMQ